MQLFIQWVIYILEPKYIATLFSVFSLFLCSNVFAAISGPCAGCHTMHNSQNNAPMEFDGNATPNNQLLRGTCYGCHAMDIPNAIYTIGTDSIPQVYHTGATDLAGGNFAYIDGTKGPGSDNRGHNISDLTGTDATILMLPGGLRSTGHDDGSTVNTTNLSCAGTNGCHGNRLSPDPSYEGITGAHHDNSSGLVTPATTNIEPGQSYRFLLGVWGLEHTDWELTKTNSSHNEYYGIGTPFTYTGCGVATSCHGNGGIRPNNGTISQFCATCHGNFHTLDTTLAGVRSEGVGPNTTDPFIRHPSDFTIPNSGEYASYTVYDLEAPVARTTLPAVSNNIVNPGIDAVMCLSCHASHASNYPDMLRWDYSNMITGSANTGGCFVCHSTKN